MNFSKIVSMAFLAASFFSSALVDAQTQDNPLIINISTANNGVNKNMDTWYLGRRANIAKERDLIGAENVTGLRIRAPKEYDMDKVGNRFELTQTQKNELDEDLAKTANLAGTATKIAIMSSGDGLSSFYTKNNGNDIKSKTWKALFKRSIEYVESQGYTVGYIEPLNEPANKTGSPENWNQVLGHFQADSKLTQYPIVGPSTFGFKNAKKNWWDVMGSQVDWGATHVLGSRGTGNQFKGFVQAVLDSGKEYFSSEIHSLVEVIISAKMGSIGGEWWPRELNTVNGNFVKSIINDRWINQSYVEKIDNSTNYAAGVAFRVPNQNRIDVYAESRNDTVYFRIVSNENVSFNGGTNRKTFDFVANHNDEQQIVVTW